MNSGDTAWVLASAALVSLLSGLFFGVIPALSTTRTELSSALKESAAAAAPGGSPARSAIAVLVGFLATLALREGSPYTDATATDTSRRT